MLCYHQVLRSSVSHERAELYGVWKKEKQAYTTLHKTTLHYHYTTSHHTTSHHTTPHHTTSHHTTLHHTTSHHTTSHHAIHHPILLLTLYSHLPPLRTPLTPTCVRSRSSCKTPQIRSLLPSPPHPTSTTNPENPFSTTLSVNNSLF